MKLDSIGELFSYLKKDRMSLVYAGSFEDAVTTKAIKLSEHNLSKSEDLTSLKKKSSFLMAECFQNVVRHNEGEKISKYHPAQQGFFLTRSRDHMYYIASANVIQNEFIPSLKENLNHINELDKDELKKLYMDVLRNKGLSEKGGAGLGLIEMARKSNHPLTFDFKKVGDEDSLFYLLIQMKNLKSEEESQLIDIADVEEIHRIMIDNDILLIYKGDFSQEAISPITNMLETNLKSHDLEHYENKKIFVTLVEMIQNISTHAVEQNGVKPGILAISRKGEKIQLGCGNFVANGARDKISAHIQEINELDSESLRKRYKESLFKTTLEDYKAELGLIDIAKTSKNPLQFHFDDNIDDKSFYSLMVDF
jgi:hypothetical protein